MAKNGDKDGLKSLFNETLKAQYENALAEKKKKPIYFDNKGQVKSDAEPKEIESLEPKGGVYEPPTWGLLGTIDYVIIDGMTFIAGKVPKLLIRSVSFIKDYQQDMISFYARVIFEAEGKKLLCNIPMEVAENVSEVGLLNMAINKFAELTGEDTKEQWVNWFGKNYPSGSPTTYQTGNVIYGNSFSSPSPSSFSTSELSKQLPGVMEAVNHPVSGFKDTIWSIIQNLNDSHRWSREEIADWLDTLDVDLSFGQEPKEPEVIAEVKTHNPQDKQISIEFELESINLDVLNEWMGGTNDNEVG